jgi:hypothetical protein
LRSHAQEQLERLAANYFNCAENMTATFSSGIKGVGLRATSGTVSGAIGFPIARAIIRATHTRHSPLR